MTLHTSHSTFHTLLLTLQTLHFYLTFSTLHRKQNPCHGKCVWTSVSLTYVWAFGFVGFILFFCESSSWWSFARAFLTSSSKLVPAMLWEAQTNIELSLQSQTVWCIFFGQISKHTDSCASMRVPRPSCQCICDVLCSNDSNVSTSQLLLLPDCHDDVKTGHGHSLATPIF